MKIPIYRIQNNVDSKSINQPDAWLQEIEKELGESFQEVDLKTYSKTSFGLIFVPSGGREAKFLTDFEHLPDRPFYILSSDHNNSLAASMEILAYIRNHHRKGEILHGSAHRIAKRINVLNQVAKARKKLQCGRLGVVGAPSDWLISSQDDDGVCYQEQLGLTVINIPMETLYAEYERGGYQKNKWTADLLGKRYPDDEMKKALNIYGALSRIVERNNLSGISVRCFDLLDSVCTTGCLGLAILNAQGIYAGCEGDIPSLVSMAIMGAVSGQPVFMCNPSRINEEEGTMVLAHCTLPVNMPDSYQLTTHYESGIGVAIAGHVPEESCTIFKTSRKLDRYFAKAGRIVGNLQEETLCRTQIKITLDDYRYFLTDPIANHHIICLGNHTQALQEFFSQLN